MTGSVSEKPANQELDRRTVMVFAPSPLLTVTVGLGSTRSSRPKEWMCALVQAPVAAGDSMTAGMAAAMARGHGVEEALCWGAATGTSNVTRKGLASGQRELIEQLAKHITVRPMRS